MESGNEPPTKARWRAQLLAQRAEVAPETHDAEARALAYQVAQLDGAARGTTVCAYVPFGTEPGSLAMLDALRARGARVLLPLVPPEPGPLDWAVYEGVSALVTGRIRGLLEPAGDPLGADAVSTAVMVLTPALAVDRSGVRLGRGAGYYDRTLPLASPDCTLVAVVRDEELVERLPAERHDIVMHAALVPDGGFVPFARV